MDLKQIISSTESTVTKFINERAIMGEENSNISSKIALLKQENEELKSVLEAQAIEQKSEYKRLTEMLSELEVNSFTFD